MKITTQDKRIIWLKTSIQGVSRRDLAEEYNVSEQYIYKILREFEDLDFSILTKMIPAFIQAGLKIQLEEQEISRVKELIEVLS